MFMYMYIIFYSSTDHTIGLVDIRKFNEPYQTLQGHRKAVSYVQYLNSKELVSALVYSIIHVHVLRDGSLMIHIGVQFISFSVHV